MSDLNAAKNRCDDQFEIGEVSFFCQLASGHEGVHQETEVNRWSDQAEEWTLTWSRKSEHIEVNK